MDYASIDLEQTVRKCLLSIYLTNVSSGPPYAACGTTAPPPPAGCQTPLHRPPTFGLPCFSTPLPTLGPQYTQLSSQFAPTLLRSPINLKPHSVVSRAQELANSSASARAGKLIKYGPYPSNPRLSSASKNRCAGGGGFGPIRRSQTATRPGAQPKDLPEVSIMLSGAFMPLEANTAPKPVSGLRYLYSSY